MFFLLIENGKMYIFESFSGQDLKSSSPYRYSPDTYHDYTVALARRNKYEVAWGAKPPISPPPRSRHIILPPIGKYELH